jgi:glycosyltransferase involved in cell wall biosynthesis
LKILIVSQGPIPLSSSSVVEGGGVRANALWKGLINLGFSVEIAVPKWASEDSNFPGVFYEDSKSLCQIASKYDVVIYNFAAGSQISEFLRDLPKNILRIADAYVPIHVEVPARRNVNNLNIEERNYLDDLPRWNSNLKASDVFLVSSQEQATYYLGILSSLGRITPKSYDHKLIYICPTGSDSKIQVQKNTPSESLSILWWGGFYPWFKPDDLKLLAQEVLKSADNISFQIVGAENPFIENKQFINTAQIHLKNLKGSPNISFAPWVPFGEREQIFSKANVVMILSQSGYETGLSWRTRLIDAVDFETPVITNGGDPFSEFLISEGAALRIPNDPIEIATFLTNELTPNKLELMALKMKFVKAKISFEECVRPLLPILNDQLLAKKIIQERQSNLDSLDTTVKRENHPLNKKQFVRRGYQHYKLYGFSKTLDKIVRKLRAKIASFNRGTTRKNFPDLSVGIPEGLNSKILLIQHQTDKSGAPLVGIELAIALQAGGKNTVRIVSGTPIESDLVEELRTVGIDLIVRQTHESIKDLLSGANFIINSCATSENWILEALNHLQMNQDVKGSFFIHENEPNLFLSKNVAKKVALLSQNRLKVFVPTAGSFKKISEIYRNEIVLNVQNCKVSTVLIKQPKKKLDVINVAMVGSTGDFRKRQIDVVLATSMAIRLNAPGDRRINLKLIGVGDDLIGSEVRRLARELIPEENLEIFGRMPKSQVLELLSQCNTVVSLADNESFGLYMAEAMTGGAVVLRTRISGFEEQVIENVNGFGLSNPIFDLSKRLSDLANYQITSDKQLLDMLLSSIEISKKFVNSNYEGVLKHFDTR